MGAAIAVAVWLSAAADAGTTHYGLSRGLREANPVVRAAGVEQHHWRIYPFKAIAASSVIFGTSRMPKKQRYALRIATIVLWGGVSVWNYQQIKRAK